MTEAKVIGFGNAMRGDDGIGAVVVEALCELGINAIAFDGDGAELMDAWQGCETVILIDAMVSGAEPGMVCRFNVLNAPLPQDAMRSSSHQFGLAQAVEMARLFDCLPPRMIVYGVEGECFDYGVGLTPRVAQGVIGLVGKVRSELAG